MLHAVVIAGGSGTRFWPQSRNALPKQLLPLAGGETMLRETLARCAGWVSEDRWWVVTGERLADATRAQLPSLPADNLIAEPVGRNTAPAIGLAAIHLLHRDPDATMLVMPADHVIRSADEFRRCVEAGTELLKSDPERFLLFGAKPTFPATGYGYMRRGTSLTAAGGIDVYDVEEFKEKPDESTAQSYLDHGGYYWNCGIFLWKAQVVVEALRRHKPEMHDRLIRIGDAIEFDTPHLVLKEEFPEMESVSIDYAVLEQAERVGVIEATFDWDDLGSWSSLPRLLGEDDRGNTIDARFVGLDTTGCIVRGPQGRLIATIGLTDCVIVQTADATLVAQGTDENQIRELVKLIAAEGQSEFL